jgi:D-alanine--poly(phosphoribitol) ligase subunit 1
MLKRNDPLERLFYQGDLRPLHAAVSSESSSIRYGELCTRVRRLGAAIARARVEPRVLVHLPQGAEAYAAMFAALAAGGVYAPMNISAPLAKQRSVLREFEPDLIVSTVDLHAELCAEGGDAPLVDVRGELSGYLSDPLAPQRLAYVMFTSGSTGKPKGVMISRDALSHYVDWAQSAMRVSPTDRWSQHPNIAFDLSVLDIYGALCGGATLFPLVGAKDRLMPATAIRRYGLTIWNSVPSVISLMNQADQVTTDNLSSLRLMTFCGEPLLLEQVMAIFNARPDLLVHNTYGPTEATVSCTLIKLTASNYRDVIDKSVALGDAIENMDVFVDGDDRGEIMISGPQLADGYWRDANATARSFVIETTTGVSRRAYRTGDYAERIGEKLYFKSRIDTQTKINGFRLELDEVNWALRQCDLPNVMSVVIDNSLHAFIESKTNVDSADLRGKLSQLLDQHAIPKYFHVVSNLPRNENDKIDSLALVAMLKE